jgi:carboxyl-terminal processing protease
MKSRFVFVLAGLIAGSSLAFASPAQDLYDQASFYVEYNYNGFNYPIEDLQKLTSSFQPELDVACKETADACSYDEGAKIVAKMMAGLKDGHSGYETPDLYQADQAQRRGQGAPVPRLGVRINIQKDKSILVIRIREDSDAFAKGLKRADLITGIDGKNLADLPDGSFAKAVRTGEPFKINIKRGAQTPEIMVKGILFEKAELATLDMRSDGVALIYMPDFAARGFSAAKIHELVAKAQSLNAKSIVLDLRDNNGGAVTELIATASAFLEDKVCFNSTVARHEEPQNYSIENGSVSISQGKQKAVALKLEKPVKWSGPLAVLVNKNAGSAPEYLANIAQYAQRAKIIGEPTAGVGNTANTPFPLINGGAATITIARSLRFDQTPYPERATPDIAATDDLAELANTGRDLVLLKGLEVLGANATATTQHITVASMPDFSGSSVIDAVFQQVSGNLEMVQNNNANLQ